METTYTREQLINAMEKYYIEWHANPDKFKFHDDVRTDAEGAIDYLLSLITSE